MVYDGMQQYAMVCNSMRWYAIVYDGMQQYAINVYDGIRWYTELETIRDLTLAQK